MFSLIFLPCVYVQPAEVPIGAVPQDLNLHSSPDRFLGHILFQRRAPLKLDHRFIHSYFLAWVVQGLEFPTEVVHQWSHFTNPVVVWISTRIQSGIAHENICLLKSYR